MGDPEVRPRPPIARSPAVGPLRLRGLLRLPRPLAGLTQREAIGLAVLGYGIVGLLLAVALLVVAVQVPSGLGSLVGSIGTQRQLAAETLASSGRTIADVSVATTRVGTNLAEGADAARKASALAADFSGAMGDFRNAARTTVLGVQPFAALVPRLDQIATESQSLADSLGTLAADLDAQGANVQQVNADLQSVQGDLDSLRGSLEAGASQPGADLTGIEIVVAGLAFWLGVAAVACVLVGVRAAGLHLAAIPRR